MGHEQANAPGGRAGQRFALPPWLSAWSRDRRRTLRAEVLTAVDTLAARVALCEARAIDALGSIAAIRAVPGLDSPQLRLEQREMEMLQRRARRMGNTAAAVGAAAAASPLPSGRELNALREEIATYAGRLTTTESEIADRQVLLAHSRDVLLRHLGPGTELVPVLLP